MKMKILKTILILSSLSYFQINGQEYNLNTIVRDFMVNTENGGPKDVQHMSPSVAGRINGNYVVTWYDTRNGKYSIYAQLYKNDGTAIGNNFVVNTNEFVDNNFDPKIKMSSKGIFVIVWQNDISNQIFGQIYDSVGNAINQNFVINDQDKEIIYGFSISMDDIGNFIVVWQQGNNGSFNIYARKFSDDGNAIDSSFLVNTEYVLTTFSDPQVCISKNGKFLITFSDFGNYPYKIITKIFNEDNIPIDNHIIVSNFIYTEYHNPQISSNIQSDFFVTWIDRDSIGNYVYLQKINNDGLVIDYKTQVNDNLEKQKYYTTITNNLDDTHTVFWIERNENYMNLVGQKFENNFSKIGTNFIFSSNSKKEFDDKIYLRSTRIDSNSHIIVWAEYLNGYYNIIAKKYSFDDTTFTPDIIVNDNPKFADQNFPSISVDSLGNFNILWADNINGKFDIIKQSFTSNGSKMGNQLKVNDDSLSQENNFPSIAEIKNGNKMVVWYGIGDNNRSCVFAQFLTKDDQQIGTNFIVNETNRNRLCDFPIVKSNSNNFAVVWLESDFNDRYLYLQIFDSEGNSINQNMKVNEIKITLDNAIPSIQHSNSGNFIVSWHNNVNNKMNFYGQVFDKDGNKIGANFKINQSDGLFKNALKNDSTDKSNNIILTWVDYRNEGAIFAQIFSEVGLPINENFIVTENLSNLPSTNPKVSIDEYGKTLIYWNDSKVGRNSLYAQRYNQNGEAIGSIFRLTEEVIGNQTSADIKIINDKIYTVWVDNRIDQFDNDIWANIIDFNNPIVRVEETKNIPSSYILFQNYPNPFNPTTRISYKLPEKSNVTLKVYDILGREITELVNESKEAGNYEVTFDASNLSSGIYYYQIKAGDFIQSKKMLLIK